MDILNSPTSIQPPAACLSIPHLPYLRRHPQGPPQRPSGAEDPPPRLPSHRRVQTVPAQPRMTVVDSCRLKAANSPRCRNPIAHPHPLPLSQPLAPRCRLIASWGWPLPSSACPIAVDPHRLPPPLQSSPPLEGSRRLPPLRRPRPTSSSAPPTDGGAAEIFADDYNVATSTSACASTQPRSPRRRWWCLRCRHPGARNAGLQRSRTPLRALRRADVHPAKVTSVVGFYPSKKPILIFNSKLLSDGSSLTPQHGHTPRGSPY